MPKEINQGINAHNITAQNVVAGSHAKIVQTGWQVQLQRPLADLGREIDAFRGPPETHAALTAAHADVAAELNAPEPNKSKIVGALTSIKELAGPATAIAQSATALVQVIAAIL